MEKMLQVKNLSKSYGNFEAVKDISFDVSPGEIFALIGPNGAGKSTALKIIAGLLSLTSGSVRVSDFDVTKEADNVRKIITYLPEDSGAYKNLTGFGYLKFMAGLYADNQEQEKEYIERGSKISALGVRLKDKTSTYSKGMIRKLLLGRAVMSLPKLAILDEPTSGLDVLNAMEIRKTIKGMAKDGMTVLLSSHNMLEIEFLSDRVAIIDKGQIYERGIPSELKKKYQAENLEEVFEKVVHQAEDNKNSEEK